MKDHLKNYIESSRSAEVRGLRILLEYFYATEIFKDIDNSGTKIISVFGSARTRSELDEYLSAVRVGKKLYEAGFAVVTGASRGIMEAANQGVSQGIVEKLQKKFPSKKKEDLIRLPIYQKELKKHSVGLSISLPMESENNAFVGVGATFHYFMVRKFFFGSLSSGFIACEGGWGTRDELYEILTLVQTGKSPVMPIVYMSPDPKHLELDFEHALRKKYIAEDDLKLIHLVKSPDKAAAIVAQFYHNIEDIDYGRDQVVTVRLKRDISPKLKEKIEKKLSARTRFPMKILWKKKLMVLTDYAPYSYGDLREAIDWINEF